jgi:hypothetical protein
VGTVDDAAGHHPDPDLQPLMIMISELRREIEHDEALVLRANTQLEQKRRRLHVLEEARRLCATEEAAHEEEDTKHGPHDPAAAPGSAACASAEPVPPAYDLGKASPVDDAFHHRSLRGPGVRRARDSCL